MLVHLHNKSSTELALHYVLIIPLLDPVKRVALTNGCLSSRQCAVLFSQDNQEAALSIGLVRFGFLLPVGSLILNVLI
jgi:hypothetical protein